ncbi:MAG: ABC-F family ATP-binding cassette domain-containing protein [Clostridia bacterium]|nr:ABC-F family ATP-binding cassette domain-containing protein [Clostridia bacterium]
MALLSLSNIKKSFGSNELFSGISFTIENNHRIGLVGVNGCGKTTLLKIIQNKIDFDEGEIYQSKNTVIGFVEQFICNDLSKTVYEEALTASNDLITLEAKIENLQILIEKNNENIESLITQKNSLEEEYARRGGYTYKSMTNSTLKGLGFQEEELHLLVEKLSGGQKTKLMLAKMLLSKANLLLLDEPTNNLDIDAIEWLESFLLSYKGSYIIVSHDRYFLDKVTNETFELENKKISVYKGNYTKYLQLKEEKNKTLTRKYENAEKEIARIEGIIEQQKTWSQERNYKIIKSKQKVIDRMEASMVKPDAELEKMEFHFETISGGNQEVLIIRNLKKKFGDRELFRNVSMDVLKKERAFIIGPNGCGKTTLLKIIENKMVQDDGEFKIGSNIRGAYYSQTQEDFFENKTILNFVWDRYPEMNQTNVRKALAIFLFKGEDVNKNVQELSGGEKARLALLLVMLSKSNFLVLDEPTNHLDINAREALENALSEYDGTLLIVSHDRYFINKLATKTYRLDKEGMTLYKGNYDYYISQYVPNQVEKEKIDSNNKIAYKEKKVKEALERKRKNRLSKNEQEIADLEGRIQQLSDELLKDENATNYEKAMQITNEIEDNKKQLEKLYEEWESLYSNE